MGRPEVTTALLWAIAIGVWVLVLVVMTAAGRARRLGAQLFAALREWAIAEGHLSPTGEKLPKE